MKRFAIILVTICTMAFFGWGRVSADEMSDLKDQLKALQETVNSLNSKIQTLEAKQESRSKETTNAPESDLKETVNTLNAKIQTLEAKQESQAAEIKKVPELTKKVNTLKDAAASLLGGVTVGAHLKFAMLDQSAGTRNGVKEHNNLSGGFVGGHSLVLYFTKELENWLKIDIQPEIDVSASATPSLGNDITRTTTSTVSTSIHQAFMTVYLPKEFELKVGVFNAMFSEDYAKETWWNEMYNMNKGTCTLQAWHDFGAELYKNIDFDKWSLPIYVSLLNGNTDQNVDNNNNKAILLHIAPEFFHSKLRLLGSLGYGLWDGKDKQGMLKMAAGLDWKYKKLNLLGEYIYQNYDNIVTTGTITADGRREGYWLRAIYTFNPKWRALIERSYANLYKTGSTTMLSDKYYSTSVVLDYSLTPNSTIICQYEVGDGHRSDGSESLRYGRGTLGWRTTF